jgi:hypothetical protein
MPGRTKYTQKKRDKALGALMASAVEQDDGSWVPQYRKVGRALSIDDRTLRRWWKRRDVTQDAALRRSSGHARAAVREEGAKTWVEAQVEALKAGVAWVLSPERRAPQERTDHEGREYTIEPKPDAIARSLKDAMVVIEKVDKLTSGNSNSTPATRLAGLRRSATKVGLVEEVTEE